MTLTAPTKPEFFLTDGRITADIQVLNYRVSAIDELGNRRTFNILVPYFVQLDSQIEKFLLSSTGSKWVVLTKEIVPQSEDVVEQAQDEFDSYIEMLAEELTVSPEDEVRELLTTAGYTGITINLSDAFLKLYKVCVNTRHGNYKDVVTTGRMEDLPAKVRGWIRAEQFMKETRKRVLAGYGIAA
jgi:hypothetical protein